ncbi:glycosyltransferase [Neobacillus sp. PS3-12]|uniref:glycosyltransferase family 2 protein n=1 Tax=Neobacillus sp. PS3-12 TaxID=3070677 RepID=UPI0027DF75FE|nr:glycosyltransferase [Neobacillus sp. PS3-12]WML54789.1 glycosyltransferase [Neobacillus sp. PS3-12]
MNPEISIVVPVYNVESFIHECIKSILDQTFKDFELILVNDGSTDQSRHICDEYAKKDKRIIVIHKENGGQSSARNKGIVAAKGSYIGFIDSDDWVEKDMYNILYTKAKEADADITACNIMQYDKESGKHLYCNKTDDISYDQDSAMHELYLNERLTFSPCNKLYKKELFENIRFKEGYILEDMDFSYRVMHQAKKIFYTGKALYNYRYNDKSTMRKGFSKKRLDEYEVRKDMYLFYLKNYPDLANELYAEWVLTGLMLYINIEKYYQSEKKQYKYLINMDRKKLKPLLFKQDYDRKKKLMLAIGVFSPSLLVMFYRLYWDKIKKEL